MKRVGLWIAATLTIVFICAVYHSKEATAQKSKRKGNKTFYPSGALESEMIYNQDGEFIRLLTYYKSGAKQSEVNYKGSINGPSTHYFENGKVMLYSFYKNAQPEGRAYANYPSGQLAYEFYYADGYKAGTWKYYNEDGSLKEEDVYQEKMSTCYGPDYSDKKYFYRNRPAFLVPVRNDKRGDTLILDQEGYEALCPKGPVPGKALFQSNCAMCHHPTKEAVGPMMKGVTKKRERKNGWSK